MHYVLLCKLLIRYLTSSESYCSSSFLETDNLISLCFCIKMGKSLSRIVREEKINWIKPHKLEYDKVLRQAQLEILENFKPELRICYVNNELYGFAYQHWFISDGEWVMEFGGGTITNCTVMVHCNPKRETTISDKFVLTPEVKKRMEKVCGATNYSLALRNCEHLAR